MAAEKEKEWDRIRIHLSDQISPLSPIPPHHLPSLHPEIPPSSAIGSSLWFVPIGSSSTQRTETGLYISYYICVLLSHLAEQIFQSFTLEHLLFKHNFLLSPFLIDSSASFVLKE